MLHKIIFASCFSIFFITKEVDAQLPLKRNNVEVKYWQRWRQSAFESHNFSLLYSRVLSGRIDLNAEGGFRIIDREVQVPRYRNFSFVSLGGKYYIPSQRIFSINAGLLYDVQKISTNEERLKLDIGVGFGYEWSNHLFVKFNNGYLLDANCTTYYLGFGSGINF